MGESIAKYMQNALVVEKPSKCVASIYRKHLTNMSKQKYSQSAVVISDGVKRRGKSGGYSSAKLHAKRDKKRQEANTRQRHYEGLTIPARISLAKSRRGESKREIARLEKLLATRPKKTVADETAPAAATFKRTRKTKAKVSVSAPWPPPQ